jgi:hypothetical protein
MTGVAAVTGAAVANPAAAAATVPIPVPLNGLEQALNVRAPKISGELPVPMPGRPEGPRYVEGRMLPERAVPQLPLRAGLPGAETRTPIPHILGDGFDHLGLGAPAADLTTMTPGLSLDAPLTAPRNGSLPQPKLPQAAVLTPLVKTVPGANLDMGAGA